MGTKIPLGVHGASGPGLWSALQWLTEVFGVLSTFRVSAMSRMEHDVVQNISRESITAKTTCFGVVLCLCLSIISLNLVYFFVSGHVVVIKKNNWAFQDPRLHVGVRSTVSCWVMSVQVRRHFLPIITLLCPSHNFTLSLQYNLTLSCPINY